MKTLILTDNLIAHGFAQELQMTHGNIDIKQSPKGPLFDVQRINVRSQVDEIIATYDLVLSIHSKQFFPNHLVESIRCINVHPGLNPHNRGWYPQVFSIINHLPVGVTIHEMDTELDHGPIIVQQECPIQPWDTSGSVYAKIMDVERELVLKHYPAIRRKDYHTTRPTQEGNLNYRKDFDELRRIDLAQTGCFGDFLNRLRAMTHGDFKNAYFLDPTGRKVYVRVVLDPE